MARHIKIADISEAEGLFHVIDAETHCGVGQSFEHGFEAEAYLVEPVPCVLGARGGRDLS